MLVGVATLDREKVNNISHVDECRTRFRTAAGTTDVEWAKAGNIALWLDGGPEINDLPTAGGLKPLSMPSGRSTGGVSGAIGLLAAECAG